MLRKTLLFTSFAAFMFLCLVMTTRLIAQTFKIHGSQLVYFGENAHLYMFDLQTHHLIRISEHLNGIVLPGSMAWLEEGHKIGLVRFNNFSSDADFGGQLFILHLRSKALMPLTIADEMTKREVVWTDDRIVFTDGLGENIYRSDYVGNVERLTETSAGYFGLSLSPDGKTIAFCIQDADLASSQLALLDVQTGEITWLDVSSQNSMSPRWSPDGAYLAFDRIINDDRQIYTYHLASGKLERLTVPPQQVAFPVWSPDGEKMLFTQLQASTTIFNLNIGLMEANGSNVRLMPTAHGISYLPSWSPDGRWIAFFSDRAQTHYHVYLQPSYNLQATPLQIGTVNPSYSFLWR